MASCAIAFSVWMRPSGDLDTRLASVIREVSEAFGAPPFAPHVTLLGNAPKGATSRVFWAKLGDFRRWKIGDLNFLREETRCFFFNQNDCGVEQWVEHEKSGYTEMWDLRNPGNPQERLRRQSWQQRNWRRSWRPLRWTFCRMSCFTTPGIRMFWCMWRTLGHHLNSSILGKNCRNQPN